MRLIYIRTVQARELSKDACNAEERPVARRTKTAGMQVKENHIGLYIQAYACDEVLRLYDGRNKKAQEWK